MVSLTEPDEGDNVKDELYEPPEVVEQVQPDKDETETSPVKLIPESVNDRSEVEPTHREP